MFLGSTDGELILKQSPGFSSECETILLELNYPDVFINKNFLIPFFPNFPNFSSFILSSYFEEFQIVELLIKGIYSLSIQFQTMLFSHLFFSFQIWLEAIQKILMTNL